MKCIIVNDDHLMKNSILNLIDQSGDLKLMSVFTTTSEAISFLNNHQVDVVFFDIQMYDVNGLEFLHLIPEGIFVIYIPAFSPFSYTNETVLRKPKGTSVIAKRFQKGIEKAKSYSNVFRNENRFNFEDYFVI